MDEVDRRILNLLQQDCSQSVAHLAQKARVSLPTCHRRLQKLRQDGVIEREVAIIAHAWTSRPLTVLLEVTLERQSEKLQRSFEEKMRRAESVAQCYMVSGHVDYFVVMHLRDMSEYHAIVRQLLTSDDNVRNFRSLFVMKESKFETAVVL